MLVFFEMKDNLPNSGISDWCYVSNNSCSNKNGTSKIATSNMVPNLIVIKILQNNLQGNENIDLFYEVDVRFWRAKIMILVVIFGRAIQAMKLEIENLYHFDTFNPLTIISGTDCKAS